jgi:hypothetical protein
MHRGQRASEQHQEALLRALLRPVQALAREGEAQFGNETAY